VSGYANGTTKNPTYEEVCGGRTGHTEAVQVSFDTQQLSLAAFFDLFFHAHDPTTLNRQGNDVGTQYRSGIYFVNSQQQSEAEAARTRAQTALGRPVVTEIEPLKSFWPAEDYHQNFFAKNPNQGYCRATIPPKLKKLGLEFSPLV